MYVAWVMNMVCCGLAPGYQAVVNFIRKKKNKVHLGTYMQAPNSSIEDPAGTLRSSEVIKIDDMSPRGYSPQEDFKNSLNRNYKADPSPVGNRAEEFKDLNPPAKMSHESITQSDNCSKEEITNERNQDRKSTKIAELDHISLVPNASKKSNI